MGKKKRTTLREIADRLGMSPTTVSRVLNGHSRRYRISEETEQRVRELADQLNFSPDPLARGLRLQKTSTIGLIIPDVSNPYFAAVAHAVTVETRQRGYSIVLCDSQENTEQEIEAIELIQSRNVDGLILCPVGMSSEHLHDFQTGPTPVVLVDRYFPELDLPYVASDNRTGAREATAYLLNRGHRKIACLQGLRGTTPNDQRLQGYREAYAEQDIVPSEDLIVGESFGGQNGYIETKLLLRSAREFTAILAFSNQIALGAIRALSEEGLRVPQDVSMIAFDDPPYAPFLATPLTTVDQRNDEMGQIAVRLLFTQMEGAEEISKQGLLLPTRFFERESVRRLDP